MSPELAAKLVAFALKLGETAAETSSEEAGTLMRRITLAVQGERGIESCF